VSAPTTREKLRPAYAEAKKRLGSLKAALWRLAAKAHAEAEAELDEAGKPDPRVRVVRLQIFRADCGHNFKSEDQAVSHMTRCWKSPETRTCKTCKHGHHTQVEEETGAGGNWECRNPAAEILNPSTVERGRRIAKLSNALEMAVDGFEHFGIKTWVPKPRKTRHPSAFLPPGRA
jgi:hypothetical protein